MAKSPQLKTLNFKNNMKTAEKIKTIILVNSSDNGAKSRAIFPDQLEIIIADILYLQQPLSDERILEMLRNMDIYLTRCYGESRMNTHKLEIRNMLISIVKYHLTGFSLQSEEQFEVYKKWWNEQGGVLNMLAVWRFFQSLPPKEENPLIKSVIKGIQDVAEKANEIKLASTKEKTKITLHNDAE